MTDPRCANTSSDNPSASNSSLQPPDPCAEDDTAFGQLVGGGEHLRRCQRMAIRDHQHRHPEFDALRRLGQRAEQHDRIVNVLLPRIREGAAVVVRIQRPALARQDDVIGDPHRVEPADSACIAKSTHARVLRPVSGKPAKFCTNAPTFTPTPIARQRASVGQAAIFTRPTTASSLPPLVAVVPL